MFSRHETDEETREEDQGYAGYTFTLSDTLPSAHHHHNDYLITLQRKVTTFLWSVVVCMKSSVDM